MYLLLATLISLVAPAHAQDGSGTPSPTNPILISTMCGLRPCTGISLGGNGSIHPPDEWFIRTADALGGDLNYFRLEVLADGPVAITVGEYLLDERHLAVGESDERTSVYYVPASPDAAITAYSRDRGLYLDIILDGQATAPF